MLGSVILVPMPVFCDAAFGARGHVLHVHQLLMIGAVVVHDGQQRNLVMRGGPKDAGSVVEIAVALDVDADAPVFAIGQRRANRGGRLIADAIGSVAADVLVVLGEIPQAQGPIAEESHVGDQRPVFAFEGVPQLGGDAGGADGAGVEAEGGGFEIALAIAGRVVGELLAAGCRRRCLRSAVINFLQASISAGRVVSASAAMERSTSV